MGKIHDALEKSGRAKALKVVPAIKKEPTPKHKATSTADTTADVEAFDIRDVAPAKPQMSSGPQLDSRLVAYHDPTGVEAEIFKILRTNILFPKTGTPPRSIMVTSAIPGDGKSFVAANLAISVAQSVEEHVLLMDCDMRRSSIHTRFGFPEGVPGLSDYLSHRQPLETLLKKTVVDKLTILPGGTPPDNPSELLSSQVMKDLLRETKQRYRDRYIIIDTPPPQLTAETTALAKYIDGIIIVVKYGATPKDLVMELVEKVGKEKIIGVVMNSYRVPTTERYGYGKYKKYQKE